MKDVDIVAKLEDEAQRMRIVADGLDEQASKLTVALRVEQDLKERKPATTTTRKTAARKKQHRVSPAAAEKVLAVVSRLDEAKGTRDIAEMVGDLSPATVGKALSQLKDEEKIRLAGMEQGVRGRRPLYAPWPEGRRVLEEVRDAG